MSGRRTAVEAMPWVFILIWSTGFVAARLAMPFAPPFSFLSARFALSIVCFLAWIAMVGAAWPRGARQWVHLAVTGLLMQAGYLGGVWAAIKDGAGAGIVALLVGLQPVLTAIWVTARRAHGATHVPARQWLGLVLGFAGLAFVVWPKLGSGEVTHVNLAYAIVALASITAGTLYQKRFVAPCDVRTASCVQMIAALIACLPIALLEPAAMHWNRELVFALFWSVAVLTLGGNSLLYLLIQRGEATEVTSLLYLVPPCTALMAWLLFAESFTPVMLFGMALTVAGVALVVRKRRETPDLAAPLQEIS